MERNRCLVILSFSLMMAHGLASNAYESTINKCLWTYSDASSKLNIINNITKTTLSLMKRMSIKNRNGNETTFDFIPGSNTQEPIVVTGGLWYKIDYFKGFFEILTTQSNFKEVLIEVDNLRLEAERQTRVINELRSNGHPIIVVARETQPESIYDSLKRGLMPNFVNTAAEIQGLLKSGKIKENSQRNYSFTSEEHADNVYDIIKYLQKNTDTSGENFLGNNKIQLLSLSYGVGVLKAFKGKYKDMVQHTTIIAPLSYSGDNFPKETKMMDTFLTSLKAPWLPFKWNLLTASFAAFNTKMIDELVNSMTEYTYSKKLVDGAFSNDSELSAREKEFPGYKEIVRQGLALDMAAARDFKLGDKKDFDLFSENTSLYFAGDEEPDRLKSQLTDYLKMRKVLKEKTPNLIIMDDAEHAITASAPIQTSNIFSNFLLNDNIKQATGKIYYMHRLDRNARIFELEPWLFKLIENEINALKIGPEHASVLERIFVPEVFAMRLQYTANKLKDLSQALLQEKKQDFPPNWKENLSRPYEKFLYMDLNQELKKKLGEEAKNLENKINELNKIDIEAQKKIKEHFDSDSSSKTASLSGTTKD